jgi:HD-like signal output (HDOD) protein
VNAAARARRSRAHDRDDRTIVREGTPPVVLDHNALLKAANELEPLPASVTRLATIVARENWNVSEVEEVVSLDQALTARLLRLANSAASASRMPIGTVRGAVVRMGIGAILSIATAASVQRRIQQPIPQYGLSEGELWRHSAASALAAEALGAFCEEAVPPESLAAALLHDIGKTILARFMAPDLLILLGEARQRGGSTSLRAEVEVLGVHHGELGGLIAQHWKLPVRLVRGIIYHHSPQEGDDPVCDVVYLANIAAKKAGAGRFVIEEDAKVESSALDRVRLTEAGFDKLCEQVSLRMKDVVQRYES